VLKWRVKYKKLKAYCGFINPGLQMHLKGDFVECLEGNSKKMSIYKWYKLFAYTGRIRKAKSPGRRQITELQVETILAAVIHSHK
jgi:hypothetical protein